MCPDLWIISGCSLQKAIPWIVNWLNINGDFFLFWPTEYLSAHMNQTDEEKGEAALFTSSRCLYLLFTLFFYFFPSSQDDLVPRERIMFGLKRAVKSNCQAALFDGVLSLTDLSVKDNHCQQTQIWDLTFSLQRRAFQIQLKSPLVCYVIKHISKPFFLIDSRFKAGQSGKFSYPNSVAYCSGRAGNSPGVCLDDFRIYSHENLAPRRVPYLDSPDGMSQSLLPCWSLPAQIQQRTNSWRGNNRWEATSFSVKQNHLQKVELLEIHVIDILSFWIKKYNKKE